jgi:hypothetical protein
LPTEVRETAQLHLDGKIDQWCRLHPEYDRHSGSARHAGGAATRQSPSDDVPTVCPASLEPRQSLYEPVRTRKLSDSLLSPAYGGSP